MCYKLQLGGTSKQNKKGLKWDHVFYILHYNAVAPSQRACKLRVTDRTMGLSECFALGVVRFYNCVYLIKKNEYHQKIIFFCVRRFEEKRICSKFIHYILDEDLKIGCHLRLKKITYVKKSFNISIFSQLFIRYKTNYIIHEYLHV